MKKTPKNRDRSKSVEKPFDNLSKTPPTPGQMTTKTKGAVARPPKKPVARLVDYNAALALAASCAKSLGLFTAISANTLRSRVMPAFCRPFMNRL